MSKTRGVFGQRIANVTLSALLVATSIFTAVPFLLSSGVAAVPTPGLTTVSGNTAAGENQPGWLFGRDLSTQTPFEFNTDAASIGSGSLYVAPIDGTNRFNKMVAENFIGSEIADINSISFDYKIGAGGNAADANQFYMNVYANFAASPATKFYDCRYDVVASLDATSAFQTVTFDPLANYTVARSGSSPEPTCPTSPAAMGEGAFIRMFSLNVGDTSVNDAGLDGYLDNVVVQSVAGTTVYDFEAPYVDTTAPTFAITSPANGSYVAGSGNLNITATVTDESGIKKLLITVPTKSGNRTFTWEDGKANALVNKVGDNFTVTVDAAQLNEGPVYVVMRGTDNAGNTRYWNNNANLRQHSFIVDATAPSSFAITTPANGAVVGGVQTINAQISDPADIRKVLMTVPLKTGNRTFVWEAGKTNNSLTRDGVNFSVSIDTNLMEDGERFVVLRATDSVGNTRYWNNNARIRQHTFVVDNAVPQTTITSPSTADDVSGIVPIQGTIIDENLWRYFIRITAEDGSVVYS